MRLVPLKETYIFNSERTRTKVDCRFKLHVYLKANKRLIVTNPGTSMKKIKMR